MSLLHKYADWIFVAALLVIALLVIGSCGCTNGRTQASYRLDEEIRRPDTGEIVYSKKVRTGAAAEAPANAATPTTQAIGEAGASTSVSGSHARPLASYGLEQRQLIFYGGAALLVVGAALAFWFGQRMLSICLAGAAGVLAAGPAYIELAPYIVGAALLLGIAWTAASIYRNRIENISAIKSAMKLGGEAKPAEAIAALRESPLARSVKR